ncbi:MAG: transcriptional regulator BetI [Ruegeria sp.]
MPKLGMEPIRRDAIVKATIAELGVKKSLDVTVSQIAKRAGMSSALAHHYFGGKDQIFLAAMRQILTDFGAEARQQLRSAGPNERPRAIIRACFAPSCFTPDVIAAWMTFYVLAQTNEDALRLWRIYQARIRSNLVDALRPLISDPVEAAEDMIALIDGLYIRAALNAPQEPKLAENHALRVLATFLKVNNDKT